MKRILFSIFFGVVGLLASEHIPFGIKDTCSSIVKDASFTTCFHDDRISWVSSSNKKNYLPEHVHTKNEKDIFELTGMYAYPLLSSSNKTNTNILVNKQSLSLLHNISLKEKEIVDNKNNRKLNLIRGVIFNEDNISKFEVSSLFYYIPIGYYSIITDVESRKILKVSFVDFAKEDATEITIAELRKLVKINFLFKIKEGI